MCLPISNSREFYSAHTRDGFRFCWVNGGVTKNSAITKAFVAFLGHTFKEPPTQLTTLQDGDYRFEYQPSLFSELSCLPGSNNISNLGLAKRGSVSKKLLFNQ